MCVRSGQHFFDTIRAIGIIRIQYGNPVSGRFFVSDITDCADTGVPAAKDAFDDVVFFFECADHIRRIIGRSVVDKDQFVDRMRLTQNRFHCTAGDMLAIIYRHHDRNFILQHFQPQTALA